MVFNLVSVATMHYIILGPAQFKTFLPDSCLTTQCGEAEHGSARSTAIACPRRCLYCDPFNPFAQAALGLVLRMC